MDSIVKGLKSYLMNAVKNTAPEIAIRPKSYEKNSRTYLDPGILISFDLPGDTDKLVAPQLNQLAHGDSEDPLVTFKG